MGLSPGRDSVVGVKTRKGLATDEHGSNEQTFWSDVRTYALTVFVSDPCSSVFICG
jgi:hypothetical protein